MDSYEFEIIVGTYEEYTLGYKLIKEDKICKLVQSFAMHSHTSSVRSVSASGRYLATGGADDRIIIYDLARRAEHSSLGHHAGTVNVVRFTGDGSHLVSGGADGLLAFCRTGSWQLEKTFGTAHKGKAVLDMALHPSGKLGLSIGEDWTLRTWNLLKGRQSYALNLASKSAQPRLLAFVEWSPCGEKFLLGGGNYVELWSIATGGLVDSFKYEQKVTCAFWSAKGNTIFIGHEDGWATLKDAVSCKEHRLQMHSQRVKCAGELGKHVATTSSAGELKVWRRRKGLALEEVCKVDFGCRPTCLTLVPPMVLDVKEEEEEEEEPQQEAEQNVALMAAAAQKGRAGVVEVVDESAPKRKAGKKKAPGGKKKSKKFKKG